MNNFRAKSLNTWLVKWLISQKIYKIIKFDLRINRKFE